jgi:bacteriocin-like protein
MKKLSKEEMKKVMGGQLAPPPTCSGSCDFQWTDSKGADHTTSGFCLDANAGDTTGKGVLCYCSNGEGSCS